MPLLPDLCSLSVPSAGVCGYIRNALEKGFSEMYGLGGVQNHIFFENWPLPLTGWVFFACSSPVSDRLHRTPTPITPTYGHMREGQVIRLDLLHLMCRRHVQDGSPQDPNMLKTLTNNHLGHLGDAWCNLQHQAHQSARNQRLQNFSNRLSSWDMRPQYLDSARQNASIYLISLCSNSTICRSTQGKPRELVSRTRERSRLRPKNPETPKSLASVLKNMVTYHPPTHTFLKWPFFTDFGKHTHTPPKGMTFWCI